MNNKLLMPNFKYIKYYRFLWPSSNAYRLHLQFVREITTEILKKKQNKREEREIYIKKTEKLQKRAELVTKSGGFVNLFLATFKGIVGVAIGSTALIGDAANSLGDIVCDGVVYYSLIQARKSASIDRPWGHGKMESLGTLCVGSLLIMTGVGVGYTGLVSAYNMTFVVDSIQSISQLTESGGDLFNDNNPLYQYLQGTFLNKYGGQAAIGVSCLSIVCKETLFHYTHKIGKEMSSSTLMANAWQHRSDSFVSGAVLVGVTGSMLGFPILDPLAGLLVSGVIVKQGIETSLESMRDLSDAPTTPQETEELRKTCILVDGVVKVNQLFARKSGPFLYVECTLGVPGYISASAAHRIAELVKISLLENHRGRVANAVVHVEPIGATGLGEKAPEWARDPVYVRSVIDSCVKSIPNILLVTEVQIYYKDDGHLVLKVDVSMNPELTIKQAHHNAWLLRKSIEGSLQGVDTVDVDLELEEEEEADPPQDKAN